MTLDTQEKGDLVKQYFLFKGVVPLKVICELKQKGYSFRKSLRSQNIVLETTGKQARYLDLKCPIVVRALDYISFNINQTGQRLIVDLKTGEVKEPGEPGELEA